MFNLSKRRIYLDYASLTPIDPRVLRMVNKYSAGSFANPSSWYREGVSAKKAMDEARKSIASFIHAHADEIVFTSGGTEANNIVLQGVAAAFKEKTFGQNVKPHIIISAIEHSSIIEVTRVLEKWGCEVTEVPVDSNGLVNLDELKKAIKLSTILVSIMTVNNEIGTIQPIREIAKIIRHARTDHYPLFHTDAAQAGIYQDLNVEQLGVDFLTLDAGKVYGPRGIGALYIRRNCAGLVKPVMFGGGQENGMRSGTENLPAIAGFAAALRIAAKERDRETARIGQLKEIFINGLKAIRPDITINGSAKATDMAPHILNVSIAGIDNEFFVLQLDAAGIACSTKSSCLRDEDESYVLKAIDADSKTSVRFSFGRWTKGGDIKRTLATIKRLLARL